MTSTIRITLALLLALLIYQTATSQDLNVPEREKAKEEQRVASSSAFHFYIPNAIGSGFAAESMQGKFAFDYSLKIFPIKDWYFGGGFSQEYYDIENQERVGIYDSSTKLNLYFLIGHEFTINPDWYVDLEAGIGYTQNKNRQASSDLAPSLETGKFRDSGTLYRSSLTLGYEISSSIAATFNVDYDYARMDIRTSRELSDYFNDAHYLHFGLGITFRSTSNRRTLNDADRELMKNLEGRDYDDLSIKERRALYFLRKGRGVEESGGTFQNESDQQEYDRLKAMDKDDMTIKQKRALYFLKKKLERQNRRNN